MKGASDEDPTAEGWFMDPFGIHEQRWISAGKPTGLVRDAGVESKDEPPDLATPDQLVPAPISPNSLSPADARYLAEQEAREDQENTSPSPGSPRWILRGGVFWNPQDGATWETPLERKVRQRARHERWARRWDRLLRRSRYR